MQMAKCPGCGSDAAVDEGSFTGDIIDCINCGITLEIVSLRPLKLREMKDKSEDKE